MVVMLTAAQNARGEYLFTWQGNSNLFQAIFEVTDAEMLQANQFFYSLSLTNSISISSPDGTDFRWGPGIPGGADGFGVGGSALTNSFGIAIFYPQESPQGYYLEVRANHDSIQEWALPIGNGYVLYSETGDWNISYIPEPPDATLLALGGVAWFVQRRHQFSARKPR
jgi:hypothetical protein